MHALGCESWCTPSYPSIIIIEPSSFVKTAPVWTITQSSHIIVSVRKKQAPEPAYQSGLLFLTTRFLWMSGDFLVNYAHFKWYLLYLVKHFEDYFSFTSREEGKKPEKYFSLIGRSLKSLAYVLITPNG